METGEAKEFSAEDATPEYPWVDTATLPRAIRALALRAAVVEAEMRQAFEQVTKAIEADRRGVNALARKISRNFKQIERRLSQ